MKVILNADVKYLGEEGDVKDVARGYARNFLFPRNLALPYNDRTVAYFETRKAEIEAKKEAKRKDAASLKDKLSSLKVELVMPAGNNGKLFGAVTNQTVADYLLSQGYEIERKKIEIPGLTIKNTGKYSAIIHLYESAIAEIEINVVAQNSEKPSDEKSKKSSPKPETTTEAENTSDASVTE